MRRPNTHISTHESQDKSTLAITDDTRIRASLPTLQHLLKARGSACGAIPRLDGPGNLRGADIAPKRAPVMATHGAAAAAGG